MKKHVVSFRFNTPDGAQHYFTGLVRHKIGDNGKAITYPNTIFKKTFGLMNKNYNQ